MPIYDVVCRSCGHTCETITLAAGDLPPCPACGEKALARLMSPTSSLTGKTGQRLPGPKDTGCCGSTPGAAGCAGPGSCCGKANVQ
ncbi:hypothetical protein JCM15519_06730 [Fundidesulfovibrio butyratiphilus]